MGFVQKLCGCEEKKKEKEKEDASLGKGKGERQKRRFGERVSGLGPPKVPHTCPKAVS